MIWNKKIFDWNYDIFKYGTNIIQYKKHTGASQR